MIGGSRVRILDSTLNPVYRLLGPAYVGFWLNRRFWGQGYGTEVARRFFLSALTSFACIESSRGAMPKMSRLRGLWKRSECGERAFS